MLRGAAPIIGSMLTHVVSSLNDWNGDEEELANWVVHHLRNAQFQVIQGKVAKGETVVFYSPLKSYRRHFGDVPEFFRQAGGKVLKLYGVVGGDAFEQGDNAFFAGLGLMGQLEGLGAVIINTLCAGLPPGPTKALMLHDIFDSPMGDPRDFLDLVRQIDYLLVPSAPGMESARRVLDRFDEVGLELERPIRLVAAGYPRLDENRRLFREVGRDEKVLVYAPTMTLESWQGYASVARWGRGIIQALRDAFPDHTIIFRPHPNSYADPAVAALMAEVAGLAGCEVDANPSNYMATYGRARLMVTDMSGTAFTFAFTSNRPVVFFSPEDARARSDNPDVAYFEMRDQIGLVAERLEDLPAMVSTALDSGFGGRSDELCRASVFNLDCSEQRIADLIPYMILGQDIPGGFVLDPATGWRAT
ncbi:hypothetical protein A6A04_10540 [Paramagnetospirillum marisnigri]|uniref:Uncharacterized protein n=2 Tax=Paramagnetospirillum marisnigri TaxID=1285242 RepID=A0A178MY30_9PROT|nr:hypothetical protein A6A04_10540 [Paramagnetospirillum marisnigri]